MRGIAEPAATTPDVVAGTAITAAPSSLVAARGATWRVVAVERGDQCRAFTLVRVEPAPSGLERTLIEPFDRLSPVEPSARCRLVSWSRALGALQALLTTGRRWQTPSRAVMAGIELFPWQLVPAMSFLAGVSRRLLIADGVGLGKTIEAGLIIDEILARQPWARVLVLAPAGLRVQWRQELASRFGRAAVIADLGWLAHEAQALPADVNPWATVPLLICSWDFAKRAEVLPGPEELTWDLAVIDEAHALGAGTERASLAESVARRARSVILLTATPPDGDPARARALMNLGAWPGEPAPLVIRRSRAAVTAHVPRRRWKVVRVHASADHKHVQELLDHYTARVERECAGLAEGHARLALHVLRKRAASCAWALASTARRRRELLAQVPAAASQPALPLLTGPEPDATDEIPDAWLQSPGFHSRRAELAWLARIEDAARIASRTERKLLALRRFVSRVREPVLAFTEYRDTLLYLAARLRDLGQVALLHGELGPSDRQHVIDRFTRGDVRLLLSTDVASEGLNLHQRCRVVIMLDLPWNPARLEQRIGRLDRLGQRHRVHAMALVSDHLLDRDLLERLDVVPPLAPIRPSPLTDHEAAARMRQALLAQREALCGQRRNASGRLDGPAASVPGHEPDGPHRALDARRVLVSVLPRGRSRHQWSGMVVVVEGCLMAPDASLIDGAALALHVPLAVPHFASRAAARKFVEQHLGFLATHLTTASRRYLAGRWQQSEEHWRRFHQVRCPPQGFADRAGPGPARGVQPSLFGTYDQRRRPRTVKCAGPPEDPALRGQANPPDITAKVHERFALTLVLLRQGPGTAPGPGQIEELPQP